MEEYKPEVVERLYQPWTIEIHPYSDGGYFARVLELPGCMTEGDSKQDVLEMIEEATAEWLATAFELGLPIPEPMSDEHYSGKIFVRTSSRLHRLVAEEASRRGVSMSQWAAETLAEAVGAARVPRR
jgi:antitoxin HicB